MWQCRMWCGSSHRVWFFFYDALLRNDIWNIYISIINAAKSMQSMSTRLRLSLSLSGPDSGRVTCWASTYFHCERIKKHNIWTCTQPAWYRKNILYICICSLTARHASHAAHEINKYISGTMKYLHDWQVFFSSELCLGADNFGHRIYQES